MPKKNENNMDSIQMLQENGRFDGGRKKNKNRYNFVMITWLYRLFCGEKGILPRPSSFLYLIDSLPFRLWLCIDFAIVLTRF